MTLAKTLAAPFYHTQEKILSVPYLIYYYAYEKKHMTKAEAYYVLKKGVSQGLIEIKDEKVHLLFDINTVRIPIGYKPPSTVYRIEEPLEELLDRISLHTGKSQEEITREMTLIFTDLFEKKILAEAALVIVAKKYGVPVIDLLAKFREKITTQ